MAKKIMSWSKCKIEIGLTGDNDAMATDLTSIGVIKNQSSSMSSEAGDSLQAIATGGEIVAEEPQEGTVQIETTIIEPTDEFLQLIGIMTDDNKITTHVIDGDWSVKVTPKNKGAVGIMAPKCSLTYAPTWDEEEGRAGVLTINILKTTEVASTTDTEGNEVDNNYWYEQFTTESAL